MSSWFREESRKVSEMSTRRPGKPGLDAVEFRASSTGSGPTWAKFDSTSTEFDVFVSGRIRPNLYFGRNLPKRDPVRTVLGRIRPIWTRFRPKLDELGEVWAGFDCADFGRNLPSSTRTRPELDPNSADSGLNQKNTTVQIESNLPDVRPKPVELAPKSAAQIWPADA